ncbi:MAG: ankyrin repeat domain-containing protein [Proteobacteria bacterium]|nr:ankyrin repeat domain-containing protein [Pseudomonadota bacterium]
MTIDTKLSGRSVKKTIFFWLLIFIPIVFAVYFFFDGEGVTPLMRAARSGQIQNLSSLIKKGADLDKKSKYDWTALMFASSEGHEKAVILLLDAGANPNNRSQEVDSSFETTAGYPPSTALAVAIRESHLSIANILIDRGTFIDSDSVALAGRSGDIALLKKMIKKGADINKPSTSAYVESPLCGASEGGNLEIVKWLIANGADPNLLANGHTALEEAIRKDNSEIVLYLLKHGADPNIVFGSTKDTALIVAVTKHTWSGKYDENLAIIKMLLSYGADKSHKAFNGQHTALGFKIIQRKNGLKYIKPKMDPEMRKIHTDSLAHDDAVIELLENHKMLTTSSSRPQEAM